MIAAKERITMMAIAGGLLVALLLIYVLQPSEHDKRMTGESPSRSATAPTGRSIATLSSDALQRCRTTVAGATRDGLIRQRPSPGRIDVDEALWNDLAPSGRSRLMRALACDAWEAPVPPRGEQAVAYGRSSGRQLAVLRGLRRPG